ncbi:oocyte zinc finger protein XlCOF22-like [Homalodisca vitripennis]|nr:oocyte zinc finger protein XlCOF22-like [Homalodisca vitripennis]
MNQEEALRGVSLEALSHIMQSSCHPSSSQFNLLAEGFGTNPGYQSPCTIQTYNNVQEKTEEPVAEAVYSDDDERSTANDIGVLCSVCKMSFRNTSELLSHRRSVHRGQISCEFCGKNFANTHNLKIHSFSHTGDTRSKSFCNSCGKGFV